MQTTYYQTPTHAVAVNYKVASASLARAIIATYHPDTDSVLTTPPGNGNGTDYPDGHNADTIRWHEQCPKIDPSEREHVVLLIRDPIEKFRSACAESDITDVDALLDKLEAGDSRNVHFWPQSRFEGITKYYRFESDLEQMANDLGLDWPLPNITKPGGSKTPKPNLTPDQLTRVKTIYAEDLALHTA